MEAWTNYAWCPYGLAEPGRCPSCPKEMPLTCTWWWCGFEGQQSAVAGCCVCSTNTRSVCGKAQLSRKLLSTAAGSLLLWNRSLRCVTSATGAAVCLTSLQRSPSICFLLLPVQLSPPPSMSAPPPVTAFNCTTCDKVRALPVGCKAFSQAAEGKEGQHAELEIGNSVV